MWKSSPARHLKYKLIDFVPINKSIMANKLISGYIRHSFKKTMENPNKTARISRQSPESSECLLIHIEYFLKKSIENL